MKTAMMLANQLEGALDEMLAGLTAKTGKFNDVDPRGLRRAARRILCRMRPPAPDSS